jgi:hypothetical protein
LNIISEKLKQQVEVKSIEKKIRSNRLSDHDGCECDCHEYGNSRCYECSDNDDDDDDDDMDDDDNDDMDDDDDRISQSTFQNAIDYINSLVDSSNRLFKIKDMINGVEILLLCLRELIKLKTKIHFSNIYGNNSDLYKTQKISLFTIICDILQDKFLSHKFEKSEKTQFFEKLNNIAESINPNKKKTIIDGYVFDEISSSDYKEKFVEQLFRISSLLENSKLIN